MSGQKILQAVRRISLVAVLSGAVVATAFPAAALPPGGASADTPGTSTSVSPRTVEQCGTLNWNVAGFPAGETVHIKIDDGDGTDQATHGAGVVQTQRIGSGGTASGSLQIPCNMAPGGHWLRYLATGGENNLGYTARAGSDFTVVARAGGNAGAAGAAGQRPQSQAGGAGQNQPARNNQAGAAQANRNQPTRNQGQAPARGQGQPAARNQGAGAAAPARSGGNAGAGGAAAGGSGAGSTAAGSTRAAAGSGGGGGAAGRAAGAAAPAGTNTGDGGAAGATGAGAIGIDGAFLAQDAGTGTAGVFDKNADDPSQPSAISQAAAQQASGARAPVIGLFVGGAILLVGLTAINVWVLLQLRRDRREEQYQRPTQYFHGG